MEETRRAGPVGRLRLRRSHVCTEKPAACPRSVRDENRADNGSTGRGMVIREIVDRVSRLACDGGKVAAAAPFFISKRNEAIVDVARLFC